MPKTVVVTDEQMQMYKDDESCFGHEDENVGCCITDSECKKCPDFVQCKAICINHYEPILAGVEPEDTEPVVEAVNTAKDMGITREYVLAIVKATCKAQGYKPEITSANTRDKVFIGEDDVFVVTKRALQIHRLEDGSVLGIDEQYYKTDNKGLVVEYNDNIDFTTVVETALTALYNVEPVKETEKPKNDLFEGTDEEPVNTKTEVSKKDRVKPVTASKVTKPVEVEEEFVAEELDKGGVTRSLQIISYSNGFNEIRIVTKASVDILLSKVENLFA